jgi:hypothetical protein
MDQSPRTTMTLHQRPLQFPPADGQVEPWNGLPKRQQQECRQVLSQMLVAIARHSRNVIDTHHRSLD